MNEVEEANSSFFNLSRANFVLLENPTAAITPHSDSQVPARPMNWQLLFATLSAIAAYLEVLAWIHNVSLDGNGSSTP